MFSPHDHSGVVFPASVSAEKNWRLGTNPCEIWRALGGENRVHHYEKPGNLAQRYSTSELSDVSWPHLATSHAACCGIEHPPTRRWS